MGRRFGVRVMKTLEDWFRVARRHSKKGFSQVQAVSALQNASFLEELGDVRAARDAILLSLEHSVGPTHKDYIAFSQEIKK